MKADIKHLQQMKRSNVYTPLGNYRSFRTTDGLVICRQVICRQCNQVGHFARACPGNLPPPTAPTHYQTHRHNYVPPVPYQYPWPLYTPHCPFNQYSPRPSYRLHTNRHDKMGYPYSRNATYINPSRRPAFSSADQTDNKYQARRSNISGQNKCLVPVPCIRHFASQTYHVFDRYRLLYKPLGWATILVVVLCSTASIYTVFSFWGRWQASYFTGYNLAVDCYWW